MSVKLKLTKCYLYLKDYQKYPTAIDLRSEGHGTLKYPAVTMCITNWIDRGKFEERFPEVSVDFLLQDDHRRIQSILRRVNSLFECLSKRRIACNIIFNCFSRGRLILFNFQVNLEASNWQQQVIETIRSSGNLAEVAISSETHFQFGVSNPTFYFVEFYLKKRCISISYSSLPTYMCFSLNWTSEVSMELVHQNPLIFSEYCESFINGTRITPLWMNIDPKSIF